jgi:outer membrane protein assembly complex protein YaeT
VRALASALGILLLAASISGAAVAAPRTDPSLEIDRIEVTGITAFAQQDIEDSLEVSPGDVLERLKVARTTENLQELYRIHGYEKVSIHSRVIRRKSETGELESVLEFTVTEGAPTRISSIRFTSDAVRDQAFDKYWGSLEGDLRVKAALLPGDVYDQEKVSAARRAVQDLLATEEFIGAKVDDVRISDAQPSATATPAQARSVARWVMIDFHVDLGDRVAFGFRGNTIFTQARLSGLVEEQRVLGFGKDYIGAIRARIEEEYHSEGFARVKVTPFTRERPNKQERHVTFEIDEGPRVTIDEVTFDGNAIFTSEELRQQFMNRASTLIQHGYYVEKDVQKAVDQVIEWLKSKGYLSAKSVTISTLPSVRPRRAGQTPSSVRLVVYLFEGDQTEVHSVSFAGLSAFTPEEVKHTLGLEEGQPLNLFTFSEGLETLKTAFRGKGYLSIRILNEGTESVVRYSDDNRRAEVHLEFSEGYQYRVSGIQIEGLSQTREEVVTRELTFKDGDVLSETTLAETEARLRKLNIFSVVAIRLTDDPDRPDAKLVKVSVQEGTPGILAGGPGFRNDFGARLFGQAAYTNLWGLNHTLSFTTNVNRRIDNFRFVEYQAQVAYLYPWVFGNDLALRPAFTVTGDQYINFDATTINASVSLEKRLMRELGMVGSLTYSLERVHQFNAHVSSTDNVDLRIGAVTPSIRLDTRDSVLNPTTGWFASLSYELASPYFLSQHDPYPVGYSRIQGRLDRLITLPYGITWYLSYRAGFERSSEATITDPATGIENPQSGAIPLIKQFALGGASSLRGYTEQALNRQDFAIRGSLSYYN